MRTGFIYRIRNIVNNKIYVGSCLSYRIKKRWQHEHKKNISLNHANVSKHNNPMYGKQRADITQKMGKRIERIDPETGEIKEYLSISQAAKEGFSQSKISLCINNKRKSHKDFFWMEGKTQ